MDDISGEQVQLFKGVPGLLQCALFNGSPASGTFVNDVTNVNSLDLYVRVGGPNGAVLCHKNLAHGSIIASSYAAWAAGTGQQFTFTLSETDTNQTIPSDGSLQIYFNITVTTDTDIYVATFGYGQLVDAGLTNLGPPVASPYQTVYTDIVGLVQNPVLDFTNVTVLGLGAQADLSFVLPLKKVGTSVLMTAANGMESGYLISTDWVSFNAKEPGLGNPSVSGYVLSSTTGGVRSWIAMAGGGGGTITLSGGVTGSGTSSIVTTVAACPDAALTANIPRLNAAENVFTGTIVNDQGLIGAASVEGVVLRNEHPSTALVPLQNAPLVVFSATGWSTDDLVSYKWEMNEKFFTTSGGRGARLSWEFAQDDDTYAEKSYITSSGDIAGLGYITAGFSFLTTGGMVLSENGLGFNSATASIGNNNTTVPVKFNSSNTTATAWRFLAANALTSGNMIEGLVPNSGFTGSYLKLGKSSNGSTLTSTLLDFSAAGILTISGALVPGGITMAGGTITFNNGNIGNLGLSSDWLGFTADPANGATNYAFVSSLTQGTSFNTPNLIMDFRCKNGSVDPIFRIFASGGAFFGKIGSLVTPTANDFCLSNNLLIGGIASAAAGSNACICIANSSVIPSGNIAGGTIYVQSGVLKYRGSLGTVTTLGAA